VLVAAFNLVPGFPLDGGRILRSIIWKITGNLRKSTRIASVMGRIIAYLLILLGAALVLYGYWIKGMWMAFIGWFLRNAALSSYRQLALREMLQGVKASEIMISDCQELPGDLTIQELLDSYVPNIHRCFPVMDNGHVIGIITMQSVREIPQEQWETTRVAEVMISFAEVKTVHPDDDLYTVMRQMTEENVNQLPVVEDGQFMGIIERGDLIKFINA
jgi:CBS domain-containing protein